MFVPFESLESNSKIWIYQSNRKFDKNERELIREKTEVFLTDWTAHGRSLLAGSEIFYDQFLIIAVNENVNEASGCSIDKSVGFIRELEHTLNVTLLERSKIAIRIDTQIRLFNFSDIKKVISEGLISEDTEVFNNAIISKGELETDWLQPAGESWLKRYF
ncbi:MAG: hypothetical protein MI975_21215 [Cytophagales bacterium]|nr:hypothetical protein [Cytophagales bacterium]